MRVKQRENRWRKKKKKKKKKRKERKERGEKKEGRIFRMYVHTYVPGNRVYSIRVLTIVRSFARSFDNSSMNDGV